MAQTSLNSTGVASSGALSLQSNGTTEAIGISTGQVATLAQNPILTSGTANGVAYLNGSKVVTSGSALVFDGANLGLGVTPSAWASPFATGVFEFSGGFLAPSAANQTFRLGQNHYYNGSSYIYKANGPASAYIQNSGAHQWFNAASGTAGNGISFTQAMTLDASGNFLVGQTTQSQTTLGFSVRGSGATDTGSVSSALSASTNASSTYNVYSTGAGAYRFYVTMDGKVNATITTIAAISDQRLKENIRDLDFGLTDILALKPRRYDWKEGKGPNIKDAVGFIAQEFETVFPASVGLSKAGEDGIEYKNICHEELIPTLVKAIQEQQAMIAQQSLAIESLTARITALEA